MGGSKPLKKAEREVTGTLTNPVRALAAANTMGQSEVLRETKNTIVNEFAPTMPDLPNANDPNIAQPTPDLAAEALAKDAALQEQMDAQGRARRGRASTILSGPQGLSGSTQYSARRTLLGV